MHADTHGFCLRLIHALLLIGVVGCGSKGGQGKSATAEVAPEATPAGEPGSQSAISTQPVEDRATRIEKAIARGVEFLKNDQQPDGSWGTGRVTRGFEVYSMVPGTHDGLRVATTALCVMALREAGEKEHHDRGVEFLVTKGKAYRDTGDLIYNIWAHTYVVQALAGEIKFNPDPRIVEMAEWHLDRLVRYQTYIGGWNYYDFDIGTKEPAMGPTSFGTAAGLVALWEAKQSGLKFPPILAERSVRRLEEMRVPGGSYLYSHDHQYSPRHPANRIRGSVGRTQSCNYALWLWDSKLINEQRAREGLEIFEKEHIFIQMGKKRQFPHEAWYATAPYYYYFGHYYAAKVVEKVGDSVKESHRQAVLDGILPFQEPDGSWWDYAMWDFHKPYGTAYCVMALGRLK